MKCFVLGFVGVIAGAFLSVIGYAQYSDYRVEAQLGAWCIEVTGKAKEIAELAQAEGELIGVSRKISPHVFSAESGVRTHKILDSGAIFAQGGLVDQILLLIPAVEGEKVAWEAYVGPAKLTSGNCRDMARRIDRY